MKLVVIALALVCGASAVLTSDDAQCQAPNGGGLMPVFKEFVELLPRQQIAGIYWSAYMKDAEAQKVVEYLVSEEFDKIIVTVRTLPEFNILNDFCCTKLYVDAVYYQNVISKFLGFPVIPRPLLTQQHARTGFHGMLIDIIELIPIDKVRELLKQKANSDEYVKMAIELARTSDFHNIIQDLLTNPEYSKMIEGLKQSGFKVDEVITFIKKYLDLE